MHDESRRSSAAIMSHFFHEVQRCKFFYINLLSFVFDTGTFGCIDAEILLTIQAKPP
jgi:hypothetical protein